MSRILVIDDDINVYGSINSLAVRLGEETAYAPSLADGLRKLRGGDFDLVFLDVRLPDGNGLEALPSVKTGPGEPEVIILTGLGDPDGAELAVENGVWDYLVKPASVKQITFSLKRALAFRKEKLDRKAPTVLDRSEIVGDGPALSRCLDMVAQAAASKASTLITGETGAGKELFAKVIHKNSSRRDGPFIAVDCAAMPEHLVESTLFGHKKGAFTSADRDKTGLVKAADGGTLFLDEIGELPLSIQKSFLRVLQEKTFRPVGAAHEEKSDFRLISATNRDLEAMARTGAFREDLLFRLKTLRIELPPLRERPEDLKSLVLRRVERLCAEYGLTDKAIDPDVFGALRAYAWPGNVRELFNVLEQAVIASGSDRTLYPPHLPPAIRSAAFKAGLAASGGAGASAPAVQTPAAASAATVRPSAPATPPGLAPGIAEDGALPAGGEPGGVSSTLKELKNECERRYMEALLSGNGDGRDVDAMLRISGLSRSHFYALVKKHGLSL